MISRLLVAMCRNMMPVACEVELDDIKPKLRLAKAGHQLVMTAGMAQPLSLSVVMDDWTTSHRVQTS